MATSDQWRTAYAKQAKADLMAREYLLSNPRIPACHHLHTLQMACEKLCKAYLCGQGAEVASLQRSHAYIAKQLPMIARGQLAARGGGGEAKWLIPAFKKLARQIELLAPAVDDGGRSPANCEYPWEDTREQVIVPAEHDFRLDLQREKAGIRLAKIIYSAVTELSV